MDRQLRTNWPAALDRLLRQNHPLSQAICRPLDRHYYGSVCESEFATDVMFADDRLLQHWMPYWAQHGLVTFSSPDVMRFLGRKIPPQGPLPPAFEGQIISDVKQRPEGYRINRALIEEMNLIPDFRTPDNLRLGFAPIYLSFADVWEGFDRIRRVMEEKRYEKYPKSKLAVT